MDKSPTPQQLMLSISVLSLLVERPMHPYEMYRLLIERQEDRIVKVRPGSLYHTVDKLASLALVRAIGTQRAGNRPERTTYQITDAGRGKLRHHLTDMLGVPVNEYPRFPLALSEAHVLPVESVVALLEARVAALERSTRDLSEVIATVEHESVPPRYWLDVTYQHAIQKSEIDWVQKLLASLRSGNLPWQDSTPTDHHEPKGEPVR